jgi:hypothetical protein
MFDVCERGCCIEGSQSQAELVIRLYSRFGMALPQASCWSEAKGSWSCTPKPDGPATLPWWFSRRTEGNHKGRHTTIHNKIALASETAISLVQGRKPLAKDLHQDSLDQTVRSK